MDLNKVQVIGNITQDIELKQTPNGQNVCSLSVATNRERKDNAWTKQSQVEFHNIVLWGKLAEIANEYCHKWKKIYLEWRLQTRNWEAQDGTKRYRTEIVWENLIMLGNNGWEKNTNSDNIAGAAHTKASNKQEEISVEDIPF